MKLREEDGGMRWRPGMVAMVEWPMLVVFGAAAIPRKGETTVFGDEALVGRLRRGVSCRDAVAARSASTPSSS